ncbi:alkaline-phosphatase-like protein [Sphaerosporella brunnea]|uniref:GPI ethanolamine phosphate transferase 2 n=1 Tax=Sphaerosporella brunnea TaxID=1250544 RepID=A0A5J5F803_9PEZI|nr:alkaline-phosphatase-like protein [Sphaerosporella brunnea]
MRGSSSWLLIAAINVLLPVGILLFAKGFFPYKPFLPGLAVFGEEDGPASAPFDKVVFMVVDALRSDFVYGEKSGFKFTQSLISKGAAIPYTAYATSPTVTMPRVKAITTGSIPGFLDVILNLAESDTTSTLVHQDTWLAQIKANGGKLVMYGDDTWLKLFPGTFERSDGTSSFFVSDFTEVDNNVTRHIDDELMRNDWNAMVMHYLGLDHIGHKSGPQSAFMIPKQVEMDGIVERIYTAIEKQPHLHSTLFILAGDHGMNDAGNHGGSGEGETSPALVFMSPKLEKVVALLDNPPKAPTEPINGEFGFYSRIEQSDLAPTITSLLGLPIPKNNLGVMIQELVTMWDVEERADVMMRNARQLCGIVAATYPQFEHLAANLQSAWKTKPCNEMDSEAEELACLWGQARGTYKVWPAEETLEFLTKLCRKYQEKLSGVASNYDLRLMTAGVVVMLTASILAIAKLIPLLGDSTLAELLFPVIAAAYGVMMFASSYVEEEHHFWYWVATGWFMVLFLKEWRSGNSGFGIILIMALLRIVRRWNQTGQKFAGAPDISRSYFSEHTTLLWVLIIITYTEVFMGMSRNCFRRIGSEVAWVFSFTTLLAAFSFKLSFAAYDARELVPSWLMSAAEVLEEVPLVNQARAVFGMIMAGMVYTYICEISSSIASEIDRQHAATALGDLSEVFLLTQTRFTNTPLIFLFRLISGRLSSLANLTASEITVTTLILQHVSFFAFGGANAISSVDLSNAYNGVAGYNVIVVGFLTLVSNWIGPIFWASVAPAQLARRGGGDQPWRRHVIAMTAFYAVVGVAVMAACTALRTHLFIWTVFSPKYLYLMAWCLGFHFVGGLGWGAFMWGINRSI